jgi:hypothetical protein
VGRIGAGTVDPADLLLLLVPAAALVVVQLGAVARRLREVPDYHPDTADEAAERPGLLFLGRLLKRYPLALLIALNALVGTLLYGLSEYLIVLIYEARFRSEAELAEFLSLLFAFMQIVEFGLLYTLTRLLLERTGPLLRNLVFPLTSLAGLVFLTVSPRLLSAVVVQVNIEAASNALFLPIGNANYVPLPLGLQGRARTLSEGIFYPAGLALAGVILWTADAETAALQVEFAALIFAGLFVLLGAGVGLLFLPTLHANVGSGLITPGLITPGQTLSSDAAAPPAPRLRALLQSREPELRLLGIALARRLDPAALEDDLRAVARRSDRATRTALAPLVAAAAGPWAQHFLDRCLTGESEEELELALLTMLIRRMQLQPEHMARVRGARDPTVMALAHVVAKGPGAWPQLQPLVRTPGVASDLVDALVCAGRTDCNPLLLACLETAGPEQQHRALVMLNASAQPPHGAPSELLRRLARRREAPVRAEAIVALSRTMPRSAGLRQLVAALDDPSSRVRRRAAQALCQHGARATALLRHRLCTVTMTSMDVVWALAWIGSPRARRLLAVYVVKLRQDAERSARLREEIAASPDRARWAALELCLQDDHGRIIEVILAALSPAIEARLMRRLRYVLQGADQRYRASAFELVAAGPASRLIPGAVDLLRYLLFEHGAGAGRLAGSGAEDLLEQALASMSPWVQRAAALMAACPSSPRPVCGAGSAERNPAGERAMDSDDQELERVVALKRTPLFRYVPFETLLEVARSAQARGYLAGEQVQAGGTGGQDLLILEAGALMIGQGEGARTLTAPACLGEVAVAGEPMSWPRIAAVEDARVSLLRATIFQELCREHPDMALELCRLLARRLRETGAADAL